MIHENSIKSYREDKLKLSKRAKHIFILFSMCSRPWTDRQVLNKLEYFEMNQVRPRITELIKAGLLEEVGKTKCDFTGKTVRLVQIKEDEEEL
mgnify:FL=1|tara:strand:- start:386 stop:664 length:279 start_codon:yes stop_codon:yes gene_type:complete